MAEKFDYVSEIWNIADFVRDTFKRSEYNRIVLPFALFRRLECALEDTRDAVMQALAEHEAEWGRENDKMGKGVTLTAEEMEALKELLKK